MSKYFAKTVNSDGVDGNFFFLEDDSIALDASPCNEGFFDRSTPGLVPESLAVVSRDDNCGILFDRVIGVEGEFIPTKLDDEEDN